MQKMKKALLGAAATGALALGLSLAGATAANASPWDCPVNGAGPWSRSTECLAGTGSYRIAIFCENPLNIGGNTVYGPWMSGGQPSAAWCAAWQHVGSAYPQTR